jgi:hypothetical protein
MKKDRLSQSFRVVIRVSSLATAFYSNLLIFVKLSMNTVLPEVIRNLTFFLFPTLIIPVSNILAVRTGGWSDISSTEILCGNDVRNMQVFVCVRAKEHYGGCWNSNFSFGLNGWNY